MVYAQVSFVCLVVLDPLVAVRVGRVRAEGVRLAGAGMVMDVGANWWGTWEWLRSDPTRLLRPDGLLLIDLYPPQARPG
jgi:hypothetical protein